MGATGVTVALVGGFVALSASRWAPHRRPGKTVWDGAFSAAQAGRGKAVYMAECSGCHLETLQGDGGASPALVGKLFLERWERKSVKNLYSRIRSTMPAHPGGLPTRPMSISRPTSANEQFPEGSAELPPEAEALKAVVVQQNKP